ncbi:GNAT family N-acetyltransferase [Alteromonas facilis]|uniref:GNAT family N-acetyltransferase n=1 Tax=Alteromonas facilis TaxID=2048004 RepID=UPI000C295402|nr:GNAT family N-acetyltransferase [Alteromonas facilis]
MHITPSERLRFRLLDPNNPADEEHLFQLDQDPEVMRFISGGKTTQRETLRDVMLPRLATYTRPEKGWGMWGVFDKENAAFCGWILVRPMHFFSDKPEPDNLEVGWRFARKYWGQGIATEAARNIIQALNELTGINQFSALAVKDNVGSIRIMQKLGMQYLSSGVHNDPLGDMLVETYSLMIS